MACLAIYDMHQNMRYCIMVLLCIVCLLPTEFDKIIIIIIMQNIRLSIRTYYYIAYSSDSTTP